MPAGKLVRIRDHGRPANVLRFQIPRLRVQCLPSYNLQSQSQWPNRSGGNSATSRASCAGLDFGVIGVSGCFQHAHVVGIDRVRRPDSMETESTAYRTLVPTSVSRPQRAPALAATQLRRAACCFWEWRTLEPSWQCERFRSSDLLSSLVNLLRASRPKRTVTALTKPAHIGTAAPRCFSRNRPQ